MASFTPPDSAPSSSSLSLQLSDSTQSSNSHNRRPSPYQRRSALVAAPVQFSITSGASDSAEESRSPQPMQFEQTNLPMPMRVEQHNFQQQNNSMPMQFEQHNTLQLDQNMMHVEQSNQFNTFEQHNQSLQSQQQFNQQVFVDASSTQNVLVVANPDDSERQAQLAAAHQAQLVAAQQATAATVHAAHVEQQAILVHRQLEQQAVSRIQYLEQEANRRIAQLEHELNMALASNSGPHTPQARSRPPTPGSIVQPKALSFSPTHNDHLQSTQSSASNPNTASAFEVVQPQVNLQQNSSVDQTNNA